MQGFSYNQLYSALQVWPLKSSVQYLASLNRIIWLGELRLIRDLDLDIFDVTDQVALSPAATTIAKPAGSQTITFTVNPPLNAVSGTLTANWTGLTGSYVVTFADGINVRAVTLTNNATTATWGGGLSALQTAPTAVVNPLFIAERNLWIVYSGAVKRLLKRSYDFVVSYNPVAGLPKYYADNGLNSWIISPATDANATACNRRYLQRPVSLVVAGNTWLGDNVGDALFAACLMESEQWLKADDRYADMKAKYYSEILPNARGEILIATRKGVFNPLMAGASIPQPMPPMQPPQGQ